MYVVTFLCFNSVSFFLKVRFLINYQVHITLKHGISLFFICHALVIEIGLYCLSYHATLYKLRLGSSILLIQITCTGK